MSKTLRTAACLLAAAVAVTAGTSAAAADDRTDNHAGLQRVLEQAVTQERMPGIIAEVRNGGEKWFSTEGVADTKTERKRRQQDRFRVGSVTKSFTGTVVLQLVGEGKLSLDDTVEKWLPGVVSGNGYDPAKITIRMLLNQNSGLFPYTSDKTMATRYFTRAFPEHRFDAYRPADLVKFAVANPPTSAPGVAWMYSNTNYTVAGLIIEKVTGNSLAQEVERRIIRPLRLTATYIPGNDTRIRGPHAQNYSTRYAVADPNPDAPIINSTDMNVSWGYGAGNMVSTTGDLQTFYKALLGGKLLPPSVQQEMYKTVSTKAVPWIENTDYGLGIFSQTLSCGVVAWGNGGFIHGSWTYAMGSKDGRHMVVTNVNGDWGDPVKNIFTKELEAEMCPPSSK
ncbi:serine hydrolase domain-containing protein [Nonomuraea sp. NPDC050556]|uniref:serine hydrolase domain-containing protein n=1 Tax=Nonomuraea sp. NPDC050556 TaxID=3364369 RepID=UPI0037AA3A56